MQDKQVDQTSYILQFVWRDLTSYDIDILGTKWGQWRKRKEKIMLLHKSLTLEHLGLLNLFLLLCVHVNDCV